MCGIVGYWNTKGVDESVVKHIASQIKHRGPDDFAIWLNEISDLALAHRRFSVIDLSPACHQPMLSLFSRLTLINNGEIYNHLDLRIELEKENRHFDWRGHSDTEILLAVLRHWGVEGVL